MRLFLSWSGDTSREVAATLCEWFRRVLAGAVEIYFSPETPAGTVWSERLREEIQRTSFAVLIVTPDNRERSWLMWEAGALSNLHGIRVVPFLFHLDVEDLPEQLQTRQAISYRGKLDLDRNALLDLVRSMLQTTDVDPQTVDRLLDHADARFRDLHEGLQCIRPPAAQHLRKIFRDVARGIARLKSRRVVALTSFGFGAYTNFVNQMIEFLRLYEHPSCDIYNNLQPRDFIAEAIYRRKGGSPEQLDEEDFEEFMEAVAREEEDDLQDRMKDHFPSVSTIATFAAQEPGKCRRITVLESRSAARSTVGELEFLDRLMRASDDHYVIEEPDARIAVDQQRLHQSDFALWKCEELVVLTDYYPASSTLLVCWKKPQEEDTFMDYYAGTFDAVFQSPAIRNIRDFIRQSR